MNNTAIKSSATAFSVEKINSEVKNILNQVKLFFETQGVKSKVDTSSKAVGIGIGSPTAKTLAVKKIMPLFQENKTLLEVIHYTKTIHPPKVTFSLYKQKYLDDIKKIIESNDFFSGCAYSIETYFEG